MGKPRNRNKDNSVAWNTCKLRANCFKRLLCRRDHSLKIYSIGDSNTVRCSIERRQLLLIHRLNRGRNRNHLVVEFVGPKHRSEVGMRAVLVIKLRLHITVLVYKPVSCGHRSNKPRPVIGVPGKIDHAIKMDIWQESTNFSPKHPRKKSLVGL